MCGLAKTEYIMIAGRVIAGAGGGGMTTISSIVASDLVPLRKRGIVQGGGNLSYGAGAALGGVFGGFIHDRIGWRWAFLIQVHEPSSMDHRRVFSYIYADGTRSVGAFCCCICHNGRYLC